jgi:hypothetical protein
MSGYTELYGDDFSGSALSRDNSPEWVSNAKEDATSSMHTPERGEQVRKVLATFRPIEIDQDNVIDFLFPRPTIDQLLETAAIELKTHFGDTPPMRVEYFAPDDYTSRASIMVYVTPEITAELSLDDHLDTFDEFIEGWWLDRVVEADGQLNFTVG